MATRLKKPTDADRKRVDRLLETISRRDATALRRCLAWNDETIPRHVYQRLSGRDSRVLAGLAKRYGVPVDGETIDLAAVLKWFHQLLAENGRRLFSMAGEDPMAGPTSPALERWREEKWRLARIDRRKKEGELLPAELVHDSMMTIAKSLRAGCLVLEKQFGREARESYEQILDAVEREVNNLLDSVTVQEDEEGEEGE